MELTNKVVDRLKDFVSVLPSPVALREKRLLAILESDRTAHLLSSISSMMYQGVVTPTTDDGYVVRILIDEVLTLEEVDLLTYLFVHAGWSTPDFIVATEDKQTSISLYVLSTVRGSLR